MATPLFLGLVGSVVAGFLVTVLLTGLVCEQAPRLGLLDRPTQARKVHRRVTPTGGGIAIAAGLAVGLGVLWGFWGSFPGAVQSLSFWGGAAIMLATGYWDDKHALDAKAKFASLFCRNDQSALRMSLVSGTLRRFLIDQWL